MFCINCGKEIKDGYKFCDKCGAAQQESTPSPVSDTGNYANPINQATVQKAPYNKMCIIGLVISGISLLINFCGLVGIVGTIVSVYGLITCEQKNENGKALAIFGIVIGVVSILWGCIGLYRLMMLSF